MTKQRTARTRNKSIDERKEEIIKWMNADVPRGKTIPIFEDMVAELLQAERAKEREGNILLEKARKLTGLSLNEFTKALDNQDKV